MSDNKKSGDVVKHNPEKSNIFCENCDSILDISRSAHKHGDLIDTDTPSDLSSDDDNVDIDYEDILQRVEKGEVLSKTELQSIDIKEMVKNEYYKKLPGKGDIKKKIIDMIDDARNSDDNVHAYHVCRNCSFSKRIDPGFKIVTKNPEGAVAVHEAVDEASMRNKVHLRTIPRTRNFNCPNAECPSQKGKVPTEAIFFRKHRHTHETIYVCTRCLTIKMN